MMFFNLFLCCQAQMTLFGLCEELGQKPYELETMLAFGNPIFKYRSVSGSMDTSSLVDTK